VGFLFEFFRIFKLTMMVVKEKKVLLILFVSIQVLFEDFRHLLLGFQFISFYYSCLDGKGSL